jgi:zinc resistance-associated protein
MREIMKTLIAASLAALVSAGATYAIAQNQPAPSSNGWRAERMERMERFAREDMPALTDARIAGIKAGLKLTPDQEKLWPPVEQSMRDMAGQRAEGMKRWREARATRVQGTTPDLMEGLDRMVDGLKRRTDNLSKLRDAAKPLYATLDERQKRILPSLIRAGGPRMAHHGMGGHGGRDWRN